MKPAGRSFAGDSSIKDGDETDSEAFGLARQANLLSVKRRLGVLELDALCDGPCSTAAGKGSATGSGLAD